MKLGVYLSRLTRPELESIKQQLNLTDDEEEVFLHLSKGRSREYISSVLNISVGTVANRSHSIKEKVERIAGY